MIDWKYNQAMVPNSDAIYSDEAEQLVEEIDRGMSEIKTEPFAVLTITRTADALPDSFILASSDTRGHFRFVRTRGSLEDIRVPNEQPRREVLQKIIDEYSRALGEFDVEIVDRSAFENVHQVFENTQVAEYRRKLALSKRHSTPDFIHTSDSWTTAPTGRA
ncbi:hypothetical protein [Halorussus sp. AFM4]|uniref:hypothetical protein n=1 Tax=Halorussus sp. AFM4 TaxID=3421651 RepID=UPI003EBA3087